MGGKLPGKDDRRVRRTRSAVQEAFLALVVERGWDGFSVQDLCERADVGRSTFYMHFADKEEVLGAAFEDVRRGLRAQATSSGDARPLGFSRGLFEHAHEHRRTFRAFVGKHSWHVLQRRFREMLVDLVREDLAPIVPPGPRRDGLVAFLAGAFFELLIWSLEARHAPTAQEVDALFQEFAAPALAAARLPGAPALGHADTR